MGQVAAVWSLVALCSVYVLWSLLLPASLRLRLIHHALRLPLPPRLTRVLQQQSKKANACGCDGCDKSAVTPASGQPVRIMRRNGR